MAVRRCAGDESRTDRPGRAITVLDDDLLAQAVGQFRSDLARDDVGGGAR